MRADAAGSPSAGGGAFQLGARVPRDVKPDGAGMVERRKGGMSVAPDDPRRMATIVRPRAWGGLAEDDVLMFAFNTVEFDASRLHFERSGAKHGSVQPAARVRLDEYQRALAETRLGWWRIEP